MMNLIPWRSKSKDVPASYEEGLGALRDLRQEMNRLVENFFNEPWPRLFSNFGGQWSPSLEVKEGDQEISVAAEIPGVDPKDIEVTLDGRTLTIKGSKSEIKEEDSPYYSERRWGSFMRRIELPSAVTEDSVSAEHKNGVLTVKLKKSQTEAGKRIPISAG